MSVSTKEGWNDSKSIFNNATMQKAINADKGWNNKQQLFTGIIPDGTLLATDGNRYGAAVSYQLLKPLSNVAGSVRFTMTKVYLNYSIYKGMYTLGSDIVSLDSAEFGHADVKAWYFDISAKTLAKGLGKFPSFGFSTGATGFPMSGNLGMTEKYDLSVNTLTINQTLTSNGTAYYVIDSMVVYDVGSGNAVTINYVDQANNDVVTSYQVPFIATNSDGTMNVASASDANTKLVCNVPLGYHYTDWPDSRASTNATKGSTVVLHVAKN